jgi:hypothetical protein
MNVHGFIEKTGDIERSFAKVFGYCITKRGNEMKMKN